ncbi:MAG: hypothetical protein ACKO1M_00310 [Planctomycetota bacterium]
MKLFAGKASGRRCRPGAAPTFESLERRFALAAFEIAFLGNLGPDYTGPTQVYLAGGTNPMTAEAWDDYEPPQGYVKNTTRNVQFDSQEVLTSPDSVTGETYITTSDDYTWLFIAETVSANWPFDAADYSTPYASGYQAAAVTTTPPPGVIKYSANTKNANVTWRAKDAAGQPIERYFIRDAWGSLFIMQTAGVTDQADVRSNFFSAELPSGWQMFAGFLERDLTTTPAYDSAGFSQFNIFRTSADDAFQQITWNARGQSVAQQIPEMIIWGGTTSNTILGRRGQDNLIHGAQGNDRIVALGSNDRIHGDDGFDTVVFRGERSQYIVTRLEADGSLIEVRTRRGGDQARVATLSNIEALQFLDRVERTARPVRALWWKFLGYHLPAAPVDGPTSRVVTGLVRRPVPT